MGLVDSTKQLVNRTLFDYIHGSQLIYNQCWEDPRLDRQALNLTSHDRLMVITSAGCNALDYLLEKPKEVTAVDLNPKQTSLLDLKVAAIKTMEHKDFFKIFGEGVHDHMDEIYHDLLRPMLKEPSAKYWDEHVHFFEPGGWRQSFYYHGTSGFVARLLKEYLILSGLDEQMKALFLADSIEEQREIYFSKIEPRLFTKVLKAFVNNMAVMAFLGVPRSQIRQLQVHYEGGLFGFVRDCLKFIATEIPAKDNYFWWLYLFGAYTRETCPNYLKEENFEILRESLPALTNVTDSVTGHLNSSLEPYSKFVLLDHMDWLYFNRKDLLQQEWQAIVDSVDDEAQVLWRSASPKVTFVDPLNVYVNGNVTKLRSILEYDDALASTLHEQDRVHTYGSFYIAKVKKSLH